MWLWSVRLMETLRPLPSSFISRSVKARKYFKKNDKSARGTSLKGMLGFEDGSFKNPEQPSLWIHFCFYNTSLWCEMIFLSIRTRKCWWKSQTLTPWIPSAEMLPVNTNALWWSMRKWRRHKTLLLAVSTCWQIHTYSMSTSAEIWTVNFLYLA